MFCKMLRSVASEFVSTGVQLGVDLNPYPTRNHVQIFCDPYPDKKNSNYQPCTIFSDLY